VALKKYLVSIIVLIVFVFNHLIFFSQENKVSGEYFIRLEDNNNIIEYELVLRENRTFTFHSYKKIESAIVPEENQYGKGTWMLTNSIVSFHTDENTDFNSNYTLDLGNSRARFISKNFRDTTNRKIVTSLQFFESKVFWIRTLKISKASQSE